MVTLYGIKNCDTVKKAIQWLNNHQVEFTFHDVRKDGIDKELARNWLGELGSDVVINRRGTTWRGLPQSEIESLDESDYVRLIMSYPTIVKRPVLDTDKECLVGFNEKKYDQALLKTSVA